MSGNTIPDSPSQTAGERDHAGVRSPETTIVIRAFNEERWLPEVLAAIKAQTYRDFEVVLVDSGSVDRTREIAAAHGARIVRLRPEDFTFGHALNLGIEGRAGLPDRDHLRPRHSDRRAVAGAAGDPASREPDTAMVFGGQRGHALSTFSEARDFERVFPAKPQVMDDDHVFVNNANAAVRRDLWEAHRFDEGLPGLEDAEWAKYWIPLGKTVLYEPAACIFHVHTESWSQVRHRFHREGIAGPLDRGADHPAHPEGNPAGIVMEPARPRTSRAARPPSEPGRRDRTVPLQQDGRDRDRHPRQPQHHQPVPAGRALLRAGDFRPW